jgi:hypothetical protein
MIGYIITLALFMPTYSMIQIPFPVGMFGYLAILAIYYVGLNMFIMNILNYWAVQNAKVVQGATPDEDEIPVIGFPGGEA